MEKKQFAVFGLGSFGWSVALTLERLGCDVIVVDESYEKIQEISDQVSYAIKADMTEPEAMQALGGKNMDGAVVAVSELSLIHIFTVGQEELDSSIVPVEIENSQGITLPTTGGIGTILFTVGGILLMGLGLTLFLVIVRRRKAS